MDNENVTENCIIDLKDNFAISNINVCAKRRALWPLDYEISVYNEKDGWISVYKKNGLRRKQNSVAA